MTPIILKSALCALAVLVSPRPARAAFYNYQTYAGQGDGGAVGNATLCFSNNTTTVLGNFVKGIGSFSENLVIFIDSTPAG